ncbi:MAG: hypothetical protein Q8R02_02005 [Hyphomonadaceae bacterium]|nr:hypothetical protein [Hyphomonadaceae bacterium]
MMRISSLFLLPAAALAFSSPAFATMSIQKGVLLCKTAVATQIPGATNIRVDARGVRATTSAFFYSVRARLSDGGDSKFLCKVQRDTGVASLTALSGKDQP